MKCGILVDMLCGRSIVNQLFIRHIREKLACKIVIAENGQEATSAHEREIFDLILMDGQMPIMNGFKATSIIREREKTTGSRIPIIALTAHAMGGDRKRFLYAEMDDYLAKPFTPEQLIDIINQFATAGDAHGADI